ERGDLRAAAQPARAVRDPEGDEPDRKPDRRHDDVAPQAAGPRVRQLPAHEAGAAHLRAERLPAGRPGRHAGPELPEQAAAVHDRFVGQSFVSALVDLPFALPTIVAGLTLLALYGPRSPLGVNVAFTRWAILFALLFVTLPFVVRTVQPVLLELDPEMEDAAASLGASRFATFRRVILPNILPAILSGVALAFARAIGEFGAVVLISGNLPFKT